MSGRSPWLAGSAHWTRSWGFAWPTRTSTPSRGGGVTLTGGEVLFQSDFALALLRRLKAEGVHTALETTGFGDGAAFRALLTYTDMVLFDLKHYDSKLHREGTGVPLELILDHLRLAAGQGVETLVRIPVVPGYNDSLDDASGFSRLISDMGLRRVQLLPFHQFGQKKYETLDLPYALGHLKPLYPEDLSEYRNVFLRAGLDCFF